MLKCILLPYGKLSSVIQIQTKVVINGVSLWYKKPFVSNDLVNTVSKVQDALTRISQGGSIFHALQTINPLLNT